MVDWEQKQGKKNKSTRYFIKMDDDLTKSMSHYMKN